MHDADSARHGDTSRATGGRWHFRLLPPGHRLGWTPYAWLVYLSFFLAYPFFRNASPATWLWHGAVLIVFLTLYFRGFWLAGRRLFPVILGSALLGAIAIPFNPGANSFFIYAAAFLGDAGRPRVVMPWLAGLVAFIGVEAWLLSLPPYAWIPAVVLSVVIGGTNIHFAEVGRANARLRLEQERVEEMAKVAERERISRDLHDLLGHTLSVIVLKSELASKLADRDHDRSIAEIRDVERISRDALTEVRRAVQGYRARGFSGELAAGHAALAAAGVHLEADVSVDVLPPEVETTLALVLREGLTNVVRHAHATTCRTSLAVSGAVATLVVEDDGVGGAIKEGNGLAGMRERLEQMGGVLTLSRGSGLRVEATLPLSERPSSFEVVPT